MPTYDYECSACGINFEMFQSMKDDPITECPECKGKVRRLIGGGMGVIFKGSGFYSTDHKRSSASTGETSKNTATKDDSSPKENSVSKDNSAPKDDKPTPPAKTNKDEKKSA
jgi:putative FmdB family regulatory protein